MTSRLKQRVEMDNVYLHGTIMRLNEKIKELEAALAKEKSAGSTPWVVDALEVLEAIKGETDRPPCAIKAFQPSLNRNEWVSVAASRLLADVSIIQLARRENANAAPAKDENAN